jgi:hypothetical protein
MLTLDKRPCRIGGSLNSRTEKHGDEDVPALDIPLEGLMLTKEELNALTGDAYMHDALFSHRSQGKLDEPILRMFRPLVMREKFEEGQVLLQVGLGADIEIELKDVKLARVTLEPQVGGLTACSVQVQCTPTAETVAQLWPYMGHEADCELTFGKKVTKAEKQKELPLNSFGEGEQPEQGGDIGPDTREQIDQLPRGRKRRGKSNGEQPSLQ